MTSHKRYHELDWLRIMLIIGVFLHHILMPFNGDGFLVMNAQSSKVLDDIMVYFEQFRLPMLFLIAGAGAVILLSFKNRTAFIKQRAMRLLVPLIFAILIIVPPQNYIGHIDQFESYWQAYPSLASNLSTNHLWFIEYLVVFALLSLPIYSFLQSSKGKRVINAIETISNKPAGLFLFAFLLMGLRSVLKIYFPEDSKDIANLSSSGFYGFFYVMGMVLMSSTTLWANIRRFRRFNWYLLVGCTVIFYGYYFSPDLSPGLSLEVRWTLWRIVASAVAWSATLTLIGYAQQYLNHHNQWLAKCNEMIFPFYIFHQTVIVIAAFYVIQWQTGITTKIAGLLAISLPLTVLLCLMIYPFNAARVLFGVKALR
ncbi:MAG: acyltransferase family protein [Algicola sp.]|nr:acyltransferase family protein [Algicola sp.]